MTDIKPDLIITDLPDPRPSDPIEALSWLGETEEEVVRGLRERGIKGARSHSNACPLANYLQIWWNNPSVFCTVAVVDDITDYFFDAPTPDPAWRFICKFDAGHYPDLIDNG